jgi:hypothetical protein
VIAAARFGLAAAVWHHIMPDAGKMISGATYLPFWQAWMRGTGVKLSGLPKSKPSSPPTRKMTDVHRMAQHVLLRRDDDALALLRDLVADGTITATQLEG